MAVAVAAVIIVVITVAAAAAVFVAVARSVFVGVPVVTHEVDVTAASVVSAAMFCPLLGVAWRYAQVQWLSDDACWALNDHWLWIQHRRRRHIADVNTAKKAWLADGDGNAYVLGKSRSAEC